MSVTAWPDSAIKSDGEVLAGVTVGTLIGFGNDGRTPLVTYAGQPGSAALAAQSVVDLHGPQIGRRVALMFESGDPCRPMVMGILRSEQTSHLASQPGHVEMDVDGERLIVSAKSELVLRCGAASITLTKAGKILISGAYVSSRSSGVNRITGGSIQLN